MVISVNVIVALVVGLLVIGGLIYWYRQKPKTVPIPWTVRYMTEVFQVGIVSNDPTKLLIHFEATGIFPRGVLVDAVEWIVHGVPVKGAVFILHDGKNYNIYKQGNYFAMTMEPVDSPA